MPLPLDYLEAEGKKCPLKKGLLGDLLRYFEAIEAIERLHAFNVVDDHDKGGEPKVF